ncbi:MAG: energy-dependent translational throttle protein EttA [Ardenticatenaceae bacterium]|nr:energy-dependent translational throttle protein EttA [Ardenticatenaceae bacterium]
MTTDDKKIIFSMMRVGKIYPPNKQVLRDISLSFFYGAKIGVIGANGSGKSTLLKIMAGIDQDYLGEITQSPGYKIGFLEQEPLANESRTVIEVVREGVQEIYDLVKEFDDISAKFAEPMDDDEMMAVIERQGELQESLDRLEAWDIDSRLELAMDALRCPPPDMKLDVVSGGERRRVALVRLLLQKPDILLLDEPTNHLDAESVAWLEKHLREYAGTVIIITHDRYFLDNVTGWILELDRGHGIPWKGNYSSWLAQKQDRMASEEKKASLRQKTLQQELEWVRLSPKGRTTKNKARIEAYNSLLAEDTPEKINKLEIYIPPGPRLGDIVIQARGVEKAMGDRLLVEDLNFEIQPGAILGVIGPNGAGKTTLFRMITGSDEPDRGDLEIGQSVIFGYVDQKRDALAGDKTVWQEISEGRDEIELGSRRINSRAYVSRFNFNGSDQQKKVGDLSGGERNRVHLAKTLRSGANVLLLDEPTNDLDVATLRALEEALQNFAGSAIIISHDRWFLDRVATHILAFEGDSQTRFYYGTYSEYEEMRRKELGPGYDRPHRITYRKLTR